MLQDLRKIFATGAPGPGRISTTSPLTRSCSVLMRRFRLDMYARFGFPKTYASEQHAACVPVHNLQWNAIFEEQQGERGRVFAAEVTVYRRRMEWRRCRKRGPHAYGRRASPSRLYLFSLSRSVERLRPRSFAACVRFPLVRWSA